MDNTLVIIVSNILTGVLTVISLLVKDHLRSSSELQKRRWEKEDEAKKVEAAAQALKSDLAVVAALAQQKADQLAADLKSALAKAEHDRILAEESRRNIAELMNANTRLTEQVGIKADQAYKAANGVNEKILNAGLTFRNPASKTRATDNTDSIPVVEAPVKVVAHKE